MFLVTGDLAVLEAAQAVASDDAARVDEWIRSGMLVRPTAEQVTAWDSEPDKSFRSAVVQPFVLAREVVEG